ncbi:MAG: amidohydrolase family protein [Pseudomonadales bacterium]
MSFGFVDCHQHFWQLSRGDYAWLTSDLTTLYRDFLPEDLRPLIASNNVHKTIVVQAAPTDAETDFLLELAAATNFIAGVVGWVDMTAANAPERIKSLAQNPWFKGIRPMLQDIEDVNWMLRPELAPAFETLQKLDLSFDALVMPRHLENLLVLLQRYPGLRCVINHGAKPDISSDAWQPWAQQMSAIARETGAHCKLSGLLTEAGDDASAESLQPYMAHLLDVFGAARLMWGSDWPVLNLAGDYQTWINMAQEFLRDAAPAHEAEIMAGNATNFYRIKREGSES